MTTIVCHKCKEPINDKFIARINDHCWHDNCVRCFKCSCQLTSKCFELNNELFCREDYIREKFKKCSRCEGPIFPTERVLYTNSLTVFHQNCFKCIYCERILRSGDQYYTYSPGSAIVCQSDYSNLKLDLQANKSIDGKHEKSEYHADETTNGNIYQKFANIINSFRSSSSPENLENDLNSDIDPDFDEIYSSDNDKSCEIRRRTPRTTIKASQLDSLKATFTITPKPSRQMREKLAECTGLSMRVIQVWFQNRRSKERRSKLNAQRKLEKYRFSIQNNMNIEENISNSSSNSRLLPRNPEPQNIQSNLNSGSVNYDVISNSQSEQFTESRYSSSWFINRSVDLLNNRI